MRNSETMLETSSMIRAKLHAQQTESQWLQSFMAACSFPLPIDTGLIFISLISSKGKDWRSNSSSSSWGKWVQGKSEVVILTKVQTSPGVTGSALLFFLRLLQDFQASLMSSAALSLWSCAIYQKDVTCHVRKLVMFLWNGSWACFFSYLVKKKNKNNQTKKKTNQTKAMFLCFPQQLFLAPLHRQSVPWYYFGQIFEDWNCWECSGPFPFLQLHLPEMHPVQGWRSAAGSETRETRQWELTQCLHWKQGCSWRVCL